MPNLSAMLRGTLACSACVLLLAALAAGCSEDSGRGRAGPGSEAWSPVPPHRETLGEFTVVWLAGSPEEMGRQHGELLRQELGAGIQWLDDQVPIPIILFLADLLGLTRLAEESSYPEVLEECRGLAAAVPEIEHLERICVLLNSGDILQEFVDNGMPDAAGFRPGCSQFVAAGEATADGRLYHGRSLDNDGGVISFLLDYPILFIRQPDRGIPYLVSAFPGAFWGNEALNAAGLTIASNSATPMDRNTQSRRGRSNVQMMMKTMSDAHSLEEAIALFRSEQRMTCKIFMIADGPNRQAGVFETTGHALGIRPLAGGVVYTSNHFLAPETREADADPSESSLVRYARLEQLLEPVGRDTRYGEIDPSVAVEMLRDRTDPWALQPDGSPVVYAPEVFDNNRSIATNGVLRQMVLDPENLLLWVATGREPPIPSKAFVCYSLGELLGLPGAAACDPPFFPEE